MQKYARLATYTQFVERKEEEKDVRICDEFLRVWSGIDSLEYSEGSAKRWDLGCVNSRPRPEGVRRRVSRNLEPTFQPIPVYTFDRGAAR